MRNKAIIKLRRFESRLYVSLLILLSALSLPFINSCNSESQPAEKNSDSLSTTIRELETQLQAKNDSLRAAQKELKSRDSLRAANEKQSSRATVKKDTVRPPAPQKPTYVPQQPAVDYGITPNFDRPTIIIPGE